MTSLVPNTAFDVMRCRARVPAHVVHREFPAETVVLNLDTGQYHGLNPVAGRMLRAVERAPSVTQALLDLQAEFPSAEGLREDLVMLCRQLEARGVLTFDLLPEA